MLDETGSVPVCYTYHSTPVTFNSALAACESVQGQTLASIVTEQQHELLLDLIEREAGAGAAPLPVWIGGQVRHNDVTDSWRWLEGRSRQIIHQRDFK